MKTTAIFSPAPNTTTEEKKPEKLGFDKVIFLVRKPEAMAILAQRPEVMPEMPEGAPKMPRMAVEVTAGFDRSLVEGARVVGFAIPCNIADRAVEAVEVPIRLNATKRAELARNEKDPATQQAKIEESLKEANKIPVSVYECKRKNLQGEEAPSLEEF